VLQQHPEAQLDELRAVAKARDWRIVAEFVEQASGADRERPRLAEALEAIRLGKANVLAAVSLDRVSRSLAHVLELVGNLDRWGGSLCCTRDGDMDTTTPLGRAMLQIRGVMAEMERALASERSREFAAVRRAKGLPTGRPPSINDFLVERAGNLHDAGLSWDKIALLYAGEGIDNIQPATLSRRVRRMRQKPPLEAPQLGPLRARG